MSQAEELLNSIPDNEQTIYEEEHIVISEDRFITVPESLRRIAVQYDHRVETVTFDCPRYWDEHDLSTMDIYINYIRSDNVKSRCLVENISIDENDPNLIHFNWTITSEMTSAKGSLAFLVCAIQTDSEGEEEVHWNSEINNQMIISDGLEGLEAVYEEYIDIITDLLTRMDYILVGDGTVLDKSLTLENFAAEAKTVGDLFSEVNKTLAQCVKEEVDPTVPDWAKQPEKPTYSSSELTDGELVALKNGELQTNLNSEKLGGATLEELYSVMSLVQVYNTPEILMPELVASDNLMAGNWASVTSNQEYINGEKNLKIVYSGSSVSKNTIDSILDDSTDTFATIYLGNVSHYVDFIFDFGKQFKGTFNILGGKVGSSVRIHLYGSYDGETWDTIQSNVVMNGGYNNNTSTLSSAITSVTSDKFYRCFKLRFQLTNQATVIYFAIASLTITDASIMSRNYNIFNLSNAVPQYIKNLRVMLDIPVTIYNSEEISDYSTDNRLNINNLGEKTINGLIEANKKYELVYDGTQFNVKEVI